MVGERCRCREVLVVDTAHSTTGSRRQRMKKKIGRKAAGVHEKRAVRKRLWRRCSVRTATATTDLSSHGRVKGALSWLSSEFLVRRRNSSDGRVGREWLWPRCFSSLGSDVADDVQLLRPVSCGDGRKDVRQLKEGVESDNGPRSVDHISNQLWSPAAS